MYGRVGVASLDVVSVNVAGSAAVTQVRDDDPGMTFLDTLSLLKAVGRWQIYNELFHVEGQAG